MKAKPAPATIVQPNPDPAVEALRLASGIVRAHNICAPTASEAERTDTIARFIDWWNFIALPVLTGEPAPDWAALRIELIRRYTKEVKP